MDGFLFRLFFAKTEFKIDQDKGQKKDDPVAAYYRQ